jgi:hypothetical protein
MKNFLLDQTKNTRKSTHTNTITQFTKWLVTYSSNDIKHQHVFFYRHSLFSTLILSMSVFAIYFYDRLPA